MTFLASAGSASAESASGTAYLPSNVCDSPRRSVWSGLLRACSVVAVGFRARRYASFTFAAGA